METVKKEKSVIKDQKKELRKHKINKVALVTIVVPILVTAIHYTLGILSNNPGGVMITITDGVLFSHLTLYLYERYVEHKYPVDNQEEVIQLRFELDQVIAVLEEAGLSERNEIEVYASVEREVVNTIIEISEEQGD